MNTLAKSGPKGLPIAKPFTCCYRWPLKIKWQFFTDATEVFKTQSDHKELVTGKQGISDYIDGFIHRNIGEQGSDFKTSYDNIT